MFKVDLAGHVVALAPLITSELPVLFATMQGAPYPFAAEAQATIHTATGSRSAGCDSRADEEAEGESELADTTYYLHKLSFGALLATSYYIQLMVPGLTF